MSIRKIVSLTATLAFLVMLLTSIILYIVPQGRIAYWADWRLWGLSKTQWGDIHINTGFLFLTALAFHIYYNWKPIMNYMKSKARKLVIFTKELNIAMFLVVLCVVGTYTSIPPFSTILTINADIKDAAIDKYGEPPYGHAELSSLKIFTKKKKLDLEKSLKLLSEAEIEVENETLSLSQIGRANNVSPQQIYDIIKPAIKVKATTSNKESSKSTLPDLPPSDGVK